MSFSHGKAPGFRSSAGGFKKHRRQNTHTRYAQNSGGRIAHHRYIQPAQQPMMQPAETVTSVVTPDFSEFGLDETLLTGLAAKGFHNPTPIQEQAIPALLEGKDVIGIARTGTGKTAAFLLPFLHKVLLDSTQGVLILAPTRELAVQIADELRSFVSASKVSCCLCIGGQNIEKQTYYLRKNPHFVIGTPGRIKDLIQREALNLSLFTNVVLDEVDRMLDIGFLPDISFLISQLPQERQSAFFSATITNQTDAIARSFLRNPTMIQVKHQDSTQYIDQNIVAIKPGESKIDVLHQLLQNEAFKKVVVFGRTKRGINKLALALEKRGVKVAAIHGNKSQNARQRSLGVFKAGKVQALLATDVAARGIDVVDVTHVINFDEPQSYDDYIHRIGRTGRAGKNGVALTFV